MFKIRKGDTVTVIAGRDRGKQGKVLHVYPEVRRAVVEGINFVKKHVRRTSQDQQHTGIIQKEMPLALSNLMVVCKSCNAATRVGFSILKDGVKVRVCKKCNEAL